MESNPLLFPEFLSKSDVTLLHDLIPFQVMVAMLFNMIPSSEQNFHQRKF